MLVVNSWCRAWQEGHVGALRWGCRPAKDDRHDDNDDDNLDDDNVDDDNDDSDDDSNDLASSVKSLESVL